MAGSSCYTALVPLPEAPDILEAQSPLAALPLPPISKCLFNLNAAAADFKPELHSGVSVMLLLFLIIFPEGYKPPPITVEQYLQAISITAALDWLFFHITSGALIRYESGPMTFDLGSVTATACQWTPA